jgi:hypothetical protein
MILGGSAPHCRMKRLAKVFNHFSAWHYWIICLPLFVYARLECEVFIVRSLKS